MKGFVYGGIFIQVSKAANEDKYVIQAQFGDETISVITTDDRFYQDISFNADSESKYRTRRECYKLLDNKYKEIKTNGKINKNIRSNPDCLRYT